MQHQASRSARDHAKALRTGMTDAEKRLWSRLRGDQLGVKFRRQHPIGSYVLDFACLAPRLASKSTVLSTWNKSTTMSAAQAWLAEQGFQVLRFWANEVLSETDAVVNRVLDSLAVIAGGAAPTPTLPQRGRELTETAS